jgi:putative ABC transport system permease protein
MVWKLTFRSVRAFFGRYMALLLIVLLSVGFFAGLKVTQDAMTNTCENYLTGQNFYDFRLLSTLGFTDEDVAALSGLDFADRAEGGRSADALVTVQGEQTPMKLIALPEAVDLPSLTAGRLPETAWECLADANLFDAADLGTTVTLAPCDNLCVDTLKIVGLCDSPLYLNDDRGTTSLGSGALTGFLYLPQEAFTGEVYTEVALTLRESAPIYSTDYAALISGYKAAVTDAVQALAQERYEDLLAQTGLPAEYAVQAGLTQPETYVLTRSENAGYVSFENDTSIISGIANIFPVFFILIAMLVCVTTMTRMVDEERTQIGTLKAMGYGSGAITAKYLLYAGSATVLGWGIGFFLGTWGLPKIFRAAYSSLYDFAPLSYLFSGKLAALTLAVALLGILGSAWISCRRELADTPARLIRPKVVKAGRRILLERVTPLWRSLSFLQKIILRNMFRYKRRLLMMLIGISCCAGLVVTGFGVRDSMVGIGALQFDAVQTYDLEAAVTGPVTLEDGVTDSLPCDKQRVTLSAADTMSGVSLYAFEAGEDVSSFWNTHAGVQTLAAPGEDAALVSTRVAQRLRLDVGDRLTVEDSLLSTVTVTVTGVFDNYVDNFILVSRETAERLGPWEINTLLLKTDRDVTAMLMEQETFTGLTWLADTEAAVDSALSCLNYIIWLIVLFSGALAFIVIFNLTNINLAERSREIATVQVLGFYPRETRHYVLRENLVLSVLAGLLGLPLGTLLHRVVMNMISIDSMAFDVHINAASYGLALLCTVLFAVLVNLVMGRRIEKIQMVESLKAVE